MTGIEQKTPAGGEDGLYAVLPLRDIVVFPHMIVQSFLRSFDPIATGCGPFHYEAVHNQCFGP